MVLGMDEDIYSKLIRDPTKCKQCLRCNYRIHGFSNILEVRIHKDDIEKEDVQLSIDMLILTCTEDAISFVL